MAVCGGFTLAGFVLSLNLIAKRSSAMQKRGD